jgi:hypothetical protein
MRLRLATTLLVIAALAPARSSLAQETQSPNAKAGFGAGVEAIRVAPGQATGVQLSDTALLHAGITAEGGLDSNVFYDDSDRRSAPVLRVTPFLELTNLTRSGARPAVLYDLSVGLQYREYVTDDATIRAQRAFNPLVSANVDAGEGAANFYFSDILIRSEDPPYGASVSHLTRLNNSGMLGLRVSPGGGRLSLNIRYTNVLDLYEDAYSYLSSMNHDGMLDWGWKWLPRTALYLQGGAGYIHYLDGPAASAKGKRNSVPLRALGGLRGLVTEKVNLHLAAGYATAFYDEGVNPGGLSNLLGIAEVAYTPTPLSAFVLGYRHEFRNSAVGNFYDLDAVYLSLVQQLGLRLSAVLGARYELRRFQGLTAGRTDNNLSGSARLDYYLQDWLFLGAGYSLTLNRADTPEPDQLVNYVKHQVFLRLGVMY